MRKTILGAGLLALIFSAGLRGAERIPTPESVFGFAPGADNRLATYDQTIAYFKALAAASRSIRLFEAGRTTQGRTVVFALISDPANLERLDRSREIARRLAHPEGLSEAEARALAAEGRAFVHIDGGCHATEVAGPQMAPRLAYDLLSRPDDPQHRLILKSVVLMLCPTMNPDGQQMVGEWLLRNAGTPYETSGLPWLYQDYVGHDNNRDGYMLNMIESRVMEHFWRQWEPQIVYVHHQTAPFPARIWLPPFADPIGLHAPYLTSREINMIGMAMAKGLEEKGLVGAIQGNAFDAWYPGYVDYVPVFKNVPAFWTETAGNMAAPREYKAADLPPAYRDQRTQSLYVSPWPAGWWRLSDAVAYNEAASLAVLEYAARYKESLLYNRYRAGLGQIGRGRTAAPYAYVVPQAQRDPVAAVELLKRLAFGGLRVSRLEETAVLDGTTYPAGTWIVPADQEFAALARELLDVQKYPDMRATPGGPPLRPYDAAGWTLPLQMGVQVTALLSPIPQDMIARLKEIGPRIDPKARPSAYNPAASSDPAPFDSVPGIGFDADPAAAAIAPPAGTLTGSGAALAVDPAQNNAFRAVNRAWKLGGRVQFKAGGPAGGARYLISGLSQAVQADLVKTLALAAERTDETGAALAKPRVALFQPWSASMDEGWTRWILERYEFEYILVHPEDFHKPLRDAADVLILADDARVPVAGASGAASGPRGGGPARAVRPEYAYALTPEDLQGLEAFVRGGGTLVCFNSACRFAVQQLKLPVKNVTEGLKAEEFFLRGSIVEAVVDPAHPVMAGMPARAALFVDGSPAWATLDGFQGAVLARYAETGSPLLSGFLIGEKQLQGRAAALECVLDKGRVVLFGFRPQWRAQSFGTFRTVFNAALNAR